MPMFIIIPKYFIPFFPILPNYTNSNLIESESVGVELRHMEFW